MYSRKTEKSVQLSTKIQELPSLRQKNKRQGGWAVELEYKKKNVPENTYIYIVDRKTFIYIRPVGRGFALVHASVHVDEKLGRTGQKKKCCFYTTLYTTTYYQELQPEMAFVLVGVGE